VPEAGVADSQVAELLVVTVKLRAAPLLPTVMFCAAGAVPPVEAAKDSDAGLTARLGCADEVTVKLTETVCGLFEAPVLATVTEPV
jgi:hypothetical protein